MMLSLFVQLNAFTVPHVVFVCSTGVFPSQSKVSQTMSCREPAAIARCPAFETIRRNLMRKFSTCWISESVTGGTSSEGFSGFWTVDWIVDESAASRWKMSRRYSDLQVAFDCTSDWAVIVTR